MSILSEKISALAAGILQGLEEATADAKGFEVEGMKKTTVYREQKIISTEKVTKTFKQSKKNLKAIG